VAIPPMPTPSGDAWLHEIKHGGFRVMARKDGDRVRLSERSPRSNWRGSKRQRSSMRLAEITQNKQNGSLRHRTALISRN
jgi:hypothetical protein